MLKMRIVTLGLLFFSIPHAFAEVYKYVDENGVVSYSQAKPSHQPSTKIEINAVPEPPRKQIADAKQVGGDQQWMDCDESGTYTRSGRVFCCNTNCVRNRSKKNLQVNCEDQRCYAEQQKVRREKQLAEQEKRKKEREKWRKKLQKSRKAKNAKIVADCKARRDVYCNKGADEIVRIEKQKANWQKLRDIENRDKKRNTFPRYRGNDIYR